MAVLVVMTGDRRGDYYPLGHRTHVIGRGESLPIQILDERVSRKHLQVRFDASTQTYHVVDMASKNGVFVNGARVATETVLADRDRVRLGDTLLLFIQADSAVDSPAMHRFKQVGQWQRATTTGPANACGRGPRPADASLDSPKYVVATMESAGCFLLE